MLKINLFCSFVIIFFSICCTSNDITNKDMLSKANSSLQQAVEDEKDDNQNKKNDEKSMPVTIDTLQKHWEQQSKNIEKIKSEYKHKYKEKDVVLIIGPSDSGKSTLINALRGMKFKFIQSDISNENTNKPKRKYSDEEEEDNTMKMVMQS